MRAALLAEERLRNEVVGVDSDLMRLFNSWFNGGFLALERIDLSTPAAVLEKLIKYKAVHAIQGWTDSAAPAGARSALFRILPSGAAPEAADFRRGGADAEGATRCRSSSTKARRRRSAPRAVRDVLLDHQLSGGTARTGR
jgi:hypothetical protein